MVGVVWNGWFNGVSDWCARRPEQVREVADALESLRGRRQHP
ncbi:hypothetical protein [Microtetraspora sp. NBRC 13810]|nr:hypothetical protein [Microtetraspora sp. NBRC 13810]